MRFQLYKRIFVNFVLVITLFALLAAAVGAILIDRTTVNEAQRRVSLDLRSAWGTLQSELDSLELFIKALSGGKRVQEAFEEKSESIRALLESARRQSRFDFLSLTDTQGQVIMRTLPPYQSGDYLTQDSFVSKALKGETVSGFCLLEVARLKAEGGELEERAFTVFEPTPRAKLRAKSAENAGLALVAATPVEDETGVRKGVLYAGILLNRNHMLVDKIQNTLFGDRLYKGKQPGTVTIFQWDTRVATNVKNLNGNRAIGTRVSQEVYDTVLENNRHYYDRAFVVNNWYLSAYDPIYDIEEKVIGILYVGVLAQQYDDLKRDLYTLYGGLSLAAAVIVLALGLIFARRLTGSIRRLAHAAGEIAQGRLDLQVVEPTTNDEVRDLTRAFNFMTARLKERDAHLKKANAELDETNRRLHTVNRNYLDMLGFVSHELKNTLGVIFTSAKGLTMSAVGLLNPDQTSLVVNIIKSIEKAVGMTRKYLDLSRIEKGELEVHFRELDLIQDVVKPLLEEFAETLADRKMVLDNQLPLALPLQGDKDLLQVVFKNLIDNAVKYGKAEGTIKLIYTPGSPMAQFGVWNEGDNFSESQLARMFDKFVRLRRSEGLSQGTGLGLFITRDIIHKHGGEIRAECKGDHWIGFVFTLPASS